MIRLGVLDQSPVRSGRHAGRRGPRDARAGAGGRRLGLSSLLARRASLEPGLAGASPEVLIAQVAAVTSAHPGGLGRRHAAALQRAQGGRAVPHAGDAPSRPHRPRDRPRAGQRPADGPRAARPAGALGIEHYPGRSRTWSPSSTTTCPPTIPWRGVHAMPAGPTAPEVWLLGSSDESALLAAQLGLGFCFAHFITSRAGAEVTRAYRERFCASADLSAPRAAWPSSRSARTRRPRRGGWPGAAISSSCGSTPAGPRRTRRWRRRRPIPTTPRRWRSRAASAAQRGGHARAGARAPERHGRRLPGRRADRGHDHARLQGAAALVRAAGRGVRAGAARGDPS